MGQVLWRLACRGEPLEHAVRAPRVHAEDRSVWLELEGLHDPAAAERTLAAAFDDVYAFASRDFFFGGVHTVMRDGHGALGGAGDARRGGVHRLA